ncbi:MAG: tetratricopeptide repeat protein [Acidimicrobiia bacterium]|nr:tetratricopeptide repeat protein [Acidimicrobiia bacterium]
MTELEEQRDHLLASLDDLDEEYAAGDLDDDDYRTLRADYTARAAAVIRALDDGDAAAPASDPVPDHDEGNGRRWARAAAWTAGVAVLSVLAGVLIAQASGSRGSTGVGSGDIRQSSRVLLFEAGEAAATGDLDKAIERYDEVLEVEPANVEAFTYRGWSRWQQGDAEAAADDLAEAVAIDGDYPDARVFSAVVAVNEGRVDEAAEHLVVFTTLDPSPIMTDLVAQARVRERTVELYGEQGRVADALVFMDELIEVDPDDAAVRAYRGWVLARSSVDAPELAEGAEQHLLAAIELDSALPDSYVYLAFLYNFLERDDDGREQLARYDALVGPDAPAHLDQLIVAQGLREALA